MPARIAILPLEVQGQIAAGEVIERPGSVVKELAENALDAGARNVEVRLAGGGIEAITVVDDGAGMSADDAVLAFARHATSKLTDVGDLAGVSTLGFRGEALPSIAAAGRVRLVTRRAGDAAASAVDADGTGARAGGPAPGAPGTTVEVPIFRPTPPGESSSGHADRRSVASSTSPTALSHARRRPACRARAEIRASAGARLRQRVARVGVERARRFIDASRDRSTSVHDSFGRSKRALRARVCGRSRASTAPGAVRWVRDRVLTHAALDGYESFVVKGRYPAVVLAVRVAPGEMDVNVHPAKLEVRFQRSSAVHQLIAGAIRSTLRSALGSAAASAVADGASVAAERTETTHGATLVDGPPVDLGDADCASGPPRLPLGAAPAGAQAAFWQPAAAGFRPLRFVGQLFDGYLLCERDGHALLIDQHAAHERVLYERLRASHEARGVEADALLVPETVALSATESAVLAEHADVLRAAGLEGEPFGDGTYLLRTMPRLLRDRDAGVLVRALAEELATRGASEAARRAVDRVLATVACHAAVRVGQRLERTQVDALLASMDGVPVNAHCPHGRPVAVELRRSAVEALFQR